MVGNAGHMKGVFNKDVASQKDAENTIGRICEQ